MECLETMTKGDRPPSLRVSVGWLLGRLSPTPSSVLSGPSQHKLGGKVGYLPKSFKHNISVLSALWQLGKDANVTLVGLVFPGWMLALS